MERPQDAGAEILAERPFVEHEFDVESARKPSLNARDFLWREALRRKRLMVDMRRTGKRSAPNGVDRDGRNRILSIAEIPQCLGHCPVDDLEIAAARQLLELHERKIGLDAGRVAVHHEADGARGRYNRYLRVAKAVGLAERDHFVPCLTCSR